MTSWWYCIWLLEFRKFVSLTLILLIIWVKMHAVSLQSYTVHFSHHGRCMKPGWNHFRPWILLWPVHASQQSEPISLWHHLELYTYFCRYVPPPVMSLATSLWKLSKTPSFNAPCPILPHPGAQEPNRARRHLVRKYDSQRDLHLRITTKCIAQAWTPNPQV